MNFYGLDAGTIPIAAVSRCDRWQAYQRLQELGVACVCTPDGTFAVDVQSWIDVVQVRSVVQQLTASRSELIHWLERCWYYR
jgi:hypothetical protein